ncbi:MAG: NAD-dependent epimerase [Thaumarchaeota archaeon]|jgi:UDP-glucose 4-epimerase|nr:MAG: NAD-dependent epimerase [Nitrososphaerota archaeon]
MKNFLITGGTGFVGSHLAEELIKRGDSVTILDDLHSGKMTNLEKIKEKINFIKGDIRDHILLKDICKENDGIFHLAARTSVQESFIKPEEYQDVNVKGTENVFTQAREYGIKVVYASSSSVYGDPIELPIKEKSSMNPINPYAQTKVDKEKLAEKFAESGLKVIGMRYFNIFGERQSKEYAGVVNVFLERIQNKLPPKINGDGLQARDFVFVGDVVRANIMAMESNIDHAFFNVGTNTSTSVLELANIMIKAANLDIKPIFGPPLEGDIKMSIADISFIEKSLDWHPTISIQNWLEQKISAQNN